MNARTMAHDILDRARSGALVGEALVTHALTVTGDIPTMGRLEYAHCLQRQADQFAAMDDMGAWAQTHPIVIGEVAE